MDDNSRVGEARRFAAALALRAGLDELEAGRLAIVVTELGTNLVRHAQRGQLLLAVREEAGDVEMVAIDHGPGIADIRRSMDDGFSTGGTPGTGLGAIRRQARDFELHSSPEGTLAVARVGRAQAAALAAAPAIEVGGVSLPLRGEIVCGDAWAAAVEGTRTSVIVADGLGHGLDASEAAQAALDVFAADPWRAPRVLLEVIHARLRSTRGAAVTLLQADAASNRLRACGAGNVSARVLSGAVDRSLVMQHGTAGLQMRRPEEVEIEWPQHALLIVHTDGIASRWEAQRFYPLLMRDPALAAALLLRDHSRERDDATATVIRRRM
ncbi:ATP-binding protein [Ramlibacter rhizophilus]|uniref:Histidine kinase n=1 Tax=Ramlibacter rhizophilus TaxID=1781167 RepID=A0A4Z0BZ62_9BURK|nr:ATP-binding protein [Ramlibacter rhizophilus]TFZ03305.1 histidine kinase [Ramlibacter rhizophilus]